MKKLWRECLDLRMQWTKLSANKDTTCKVNQVIYIPIHEADVMTVDDLNDPSVPEMYANDVDIAPLFKVKKYDPAKHIRVRVISDFADPKWLKKDKTYEDKYWEVEGVIIDFHGGGFLIGNSLGHSKIITNMVGKNFEGPIFSVDYRLAPKYFFPDPINDSWQAYLWILKYSEKYLKLRFKKIFVTGASSGGNLGLGITTLSIQKNVRVPDGIVLTYPAMDTNLKQFSPSLLLGFEDQFMSFSFLLFVLENFSKEPLKVEFNHVMSPKYIPDDVLAKFPPCRFITAGLDPLRDESIRLMVRLLKVGVNGKWIDFRYCYHGFINHHNTLFHLKETVDYLPKLLECLNEVGELSSK